MPDARHHARSMGRVQPLAGAHGTGRASCARGDGRQVFSRGPSGRGRRDLCGGRRHCILWRLPRPRPYRSARNRRQGLRTEMIKDKATPVANRIQRRALVADLLKLRGNALVVPGLGSPTWDCFAAGDSPEYLYSWGGMGLCVPTALGLALAQPNRRILALTGDGEMMMGIGSLAVVADQAPVNLAILVLDNESFGETGRQTGLTASKTDIAE